VRSCNHRFAFSEFHLVNTRAPARLTKEGPL
jgi:hypothetical protein